MTKMFAEVFPPLHVEQGLQDLLEQVKVEKVTSNRAKNFIRVYLVSGKLIHKEQLFQLEKTLKKQLFGASDITVRILERYELSGQYNPEKLMELYKDSILFELRHYSMLEYNLFRGAKIEFPEANILKMELAKTTLGEDAADELIRILYKIFTERCGLDVKIQVEFVDKKEEKKKRSGRADVEKQAEALNAAMWAAKQAADAAESAENAERAGGNSTAAGDVGSSGGMKTEKKPAAASTGGKKNFGNFGKSEYAYGKTLRSGGGFRSRGASNNPDVLYGRDFDDSELIDLVQVIGEMGEVVIHGQVTGWDEREIRGEKTIVTITVTDYTDTIRIKIFEKNDEMEAFREKLKKGAFIKLKGLTAMDRFDNELTISSVVGIKKSSDFRTPRVDNSELKRVELHCHTKMSDMDGVSEVEDIIKRAKSWGHKAIAVTDHGVVQAYPAASHSLEKGDNFKVIYGVEGYLVDDLKDIVTDAAGQSLDDAYVVFDIETTGFSAENDRIIEIGAVRVEQGEITDKFSVFVNPQTPIPFEIEKLTGINDEMVMNEPTIEEILPKFLDFCKGAVMVAHNAGFDMSFIRKNSERQGLPCEFTVVDTVALARILLPQLNRFKLDTVAKALNVSLENHHRAVDDAGCTAEIFVKFVQMLKERDIFDLNGVNRMSTLDADAIKKLPSHHVIILAKNEIGRVNLYRMVSWSHMDYFARVPRIPKSVLQKHREGLIVGSACEAGELYQALVRSAPDEEIARLVNFYDYLEIQPLGNNEFMLRGERPTFELKDDLIRLNKKIVSLGEQFHKPVVATCDVHFLNPEDEVYRRIIMAGKGFKDADDQAPLYLRTTEEMLAEFEYLGSDKAEEVVITNTNKIADMIERISPVRPDKCPPVIENSDQTLRDICYEKAHSIYGGELPQVVTERLEKELHSIISNGFAVMYIIAQKLVWKSNADGYLVGSRGSVGSSFVATMAGITEVNPLPPHYYCPACHYSDFESEEVRKYAGAAGCDMPDKACPVCGGPLKKEGFDIPFETFLGFKGDKEPDIDLNFSGDYQSKAHKYTEVIFGTGQTFRAGTIGTLADKTAFGYVKNYYEERGQHKRNCEIDRIVQGCVGVRRSTGQHPGGIVVLPHGEEIHSFTPIQHPANDMTTDIITTHFDYHSIDHNLLKLDILGHDDPTMIRMLEDLTGLDAKTIPLDDQDVMSLFKNTEALGIKPEDIDGCPLGCLGIPEFGTDFVIQMVCDAKPQSFSDLIRISGLSHGTDVWLNNAQRFIKEGKATISTAICTRDDIMLYLIHQGVEPSLSFTIMESVRKGKGLKPEWIEAMKAEGVEDWYIESCKMIKYMFPKAHAAAYVMMAWRIAYCKINYPLAYYAAYFSIRASAFSYELMCQGKERLAYFMSDYKRRSDSLSKKEQDSMKDMHIVQEMYARGFEFWPIDIYRAKAHRFQIIDGKLMPALSTIEGLGDKAADQLEAAAKDGPFLSRDDLRTRSKLSKTVIDFMGDLGLLGDLPESNQLSLFDYVS
ncbi:PolC-type DNA polymerase III [Laedolimicola ammoniilytica]|uniref:DNA polymerase III PolC-type n=1 Tax=Laedolimicola ammoniilytica TaxID=2981771 RepID=A0ABT2RW31_9FIRM|nr:PolC-type DNA polymerase III [Laedolimicola ammoniilytica]MCU6696518.1 PolC-type DNA polymerase III [Laedolimicola ammoniilytica]SCH71907.1 DNA polymerase III polC-type [uncultured Clostridium sp.]